MKKVHGQNGGFGFTLIELLVVIAIVAVLTALLFTGLGSLAKRKTQATSTNNLRQISVATVNFAGEHDGVLPNRPENEKWPRTLNDYLQDPRVLADPGDRENWILTKTDPLTDASNQTSYIYNGFNDLGTYDEPEAEIRQVRIDQPSQTIFFAIPYSGNRNFFMDFDEGNQKSILNLKTFDDGSTYAFADGSARFIRERDYVKVRAEDGQRSGDWMWLADKTYQPKP